LWNGLGREKLQTPEGGRAEDRPRRKRARLPNPVRFRYSASGPLDVFIPLKDEARSRSFPAINILLILINVAVFFYQLSLQTTLSRHAYENFIILNGTVPSRIPAFLSGHASFEHAFLPLVTSLFLHGSLLHIAGNMLFLWVFGDNIEDYFGHLPYLLFYFFCGIGSGLLHVIFNWGSPVPAIGASGAISGVMGAYAVLFPRERILTLVFIFLVPIPAYFVLGVWFLFQFLAAVNMLGPNSVAAGGGVAVWAHVGGFLLGMLITGLARRPGG
jgi:membrane associated rhomboid family serine protease